MIAAHKSSTIGWTFAILAVAIFFFGLAVYRVVKAKPWKAWHEWVGCALIALALIVEFNF